MVDTPTTLDGRRGRPPKPDRREALGTRVEPALRRRLVELAAQQQQTLTVLVENLLRGALDGGATGLPAAPIPLLLTCPMCRYRHIDEGEFARTAHHTHACQHCGHVWRPAIGATVGVRFLPGYQPSATEG